MEARDGDGAQSRRPACWFGLGGHSDRAQRSPTGREGGPRSGLRVFPTTTRPMTDRHMQGATASLTGARLQTCFAGSANRRSKMTVTHRMQERVRQESSVRGPRASRRTESMRSRSSFASPPSRCGFPHRWRGPSTDARPTLLTQAGRTDSGDRCERHDAGPADRFSRAPDRSGEPT